MNINSISRNFCHFLEIDDFIVITIGSWGTAIISRNCSFGSFRKSAVGISQWPTKSTPKGRPSMMVTPMGGMVIGVRVLAVGGRGPTPAGIKGMVSPQGRGLGCIILGRGPWDWDWGTWDCLVVLLMLWLLLLLLVVFGTWFGGIFTQFEGYELVNWIWFGNCKNKCFYL